MAFVICDVMAVLLPHCQHLVAQRAKKRKVLLSGQNGMKQI